MLHPPVFPLPAVRVTGTTLHSPSGDTSGPPPSPLHPVPAGWDPSTPWGREGLRLHKANLHFKPWVGTAGAGRGGCSPGMRAGCSQPLRLPLPGMQTAWPSPPSSSSSSQGRREAVPGAAGGGREKRLLQESDFQPCLLIAPPAPC